MWCVLFTYLVEFDVNDVALGEITVDFGFNVVVFGGASVRNSVEFYVFLVQWDLNWMFLQINLVSLFQNVLQL